MNKKNFILLAAGTLALLFSCSENTFKADSSQPIEPQAKLYVTAQDASTGTFVAAKATLLSTGDVRNIPASGSAEFKVAAGWHALLIEKDGYASVGVVPDTSVEREAGVYVVKERNVVAQLYPLNADLSGLLYYANANGKSVPAEGVTVRISFNNSLGFVNKIKDAVTNENGEYTFVGLPAVLSEYSISALEAVLPDGIFLETKLLSSNPLIAGVSSENAKQDFSAPTSDFRISHYKNVINEDEPLVFTFSDAINDTSITNTTVILRTSSNGALNDAVDIKWGTNTVTLTPAGKWGTDFGGVSFLATLRSVKGSTLSPSGFLNITVRRTDLSAAKVIGLVNLDSALITFDSTSAILRWEKLEGALSYDVYAAKKGEGNYEKVDSDISQPSNPSDKTVTRIVNMNKPFGKVATIFRVQAVNATSKSSLSKADSVEVTDIIPPTFANGEYIYDSSQGTGGYRNHTKATSDTTILFMDYSGSSFTERTPTEFNSFHDLSSKLGDVTSSTLTRGRIFFNEPMDTENMLTINVIAAPGTVNPKNKIIMTYSWDPNANGQNLVITVGLNGEATLSDGDVNAVYSIDGLKDKKGNKFRTIYGTGVSAKTKNTADIRFTAIVGELTPCQIDKTSAECNTYCITGDNYKTKSSCYYYACNTSPTGNLCKDHCLAIPGNQDCHLYWSCEMSGFGFSSNECKNDQCGGYNKLNYCSEQTWTCDVFNNDSPECRTYCMDVGATTNRCANSATSIFPTDPELLDYCEAVSKKAGFGNFVSLPQVCKEHFTACEIYGEIHQDCEQ